MAKRSDKYIALSTRQSTLVDRLVRKGRFSSASAVVDEGLRLLAEREHSRSEKIKWLRRALSKGSRSIARGDVSDIQSVLTELDRRETIRHLRREVQKGYRSIQRGDVVDGQEFMRDWARLDAAASRRMGKKRLST
jgi:putative addiction module CopG family antidote